MAVNDAEDDWIADTFGLASLDRGLVARLAHKYPRRLDQLFDIRLAVAGTLRQLDELSSRMPQRRVLIIGVEVPEKPEFMARVRATLPMSRHKVTFDTIETGGRGRCDNLNILLARNHIEDFDWLIVTDDDISVPRIFLDRFLCVIEHFEFKIAQPAHAFRSHVSYSLTRRHWGAVARRTGFVEIGPLVAFHPDVFPALLPFPMTGMGWGLGTNWAALARDHGWRMGIVDALPIRHLRPVASGYNAEASIAEAREFLATHATITRREALKSFKVFDGFHRPQ